MKHLAAIALALLVLSTLITACAGVFSGPTPTPDPCSPGEIDRYLDAINDVSRRFDDAVTLANTTPRASLPPVISDLQEIRRNAEDLEVPECATSAKTALAAYMDAIIDAFLLFLGNNPDAAVSQAFHNATSLLDDYLQAIAELTPDEG